MHASDEELVSRTCEELSKPNNKETTPIRKLAKKKRKMGKIHNTSHQKGCTDGKHAHGKMFHIVIHQGNDFKP